MTWDRPGGFVESTADNQPTTGNFHSDRHALLSGMMLAQLGQYFTVAPEMDVRGNYTAVIKVTLDDVGTVRLMVLEG